MIANVADRQGFSENFHKATAFEKVIQKIEDKHGGKNKDEDEDEDKPNFIGPSQEVSLPFTVEEELVHWEVQTFPNDDQKLIRRVHGRQQFYFVLSATAKKVEKKRNWRVKGGFWLLGSPNRAPPPPPTNVVNDDDDCADEDDEDTDDDMQEF